MGYESGIFHDRLDRLNLRSWVLWFLKSSGLLVSFVVMSILVSACSTPVGIRYMSPDEAGKKLYENVISDGSLSAVTVQTLKRFGLEKRFESEPGEVISLLHKGLPTLNESDRLFALAELSFLHASQKKERSYFIASTIYAYAFLFPGNMNDSPNQIDPRLRTAIDIYNQGIAEVMSGQTDVEEKVREMEEVVMRRGGNEERLRQKSFKLPFGKLTITINENELTWGAYRLDGFVRASIIDVRGLRNRYRWPGIGAALVAALKPVEGARPPAYARVPQQLRVPITALLRIDNIDDALKTGTVQGKLEFYSPNRMTEVTINGRTLPIEYELSSALASSLEGSKIYELELRGFFSGDFSMIKERSGPTDGLIVMEPYKPRRIPIVLVHGTASSPARWAELLNEIINDKNLWGQYQIWLFTYNTGNPVLYSACQLVQGLKNTVNELDPEGKDPQLRKMVIIGHSQGGLLTKLTAVDSGTRFWENASDKPLDELEIAPETKDLFRQCMFYKPLPMVKRVIFLATPHRGSFVAGGWIGRLAGTFVKLPFNLFDTLKATIAMNPDIVKIKSAKNIPRSTDNMDPKSSFVEAYSAIPIAPGIKAHSIVAVKNPDDPKENWTDGVVNYESAHIEGVDSELVVHSSHSCQDNPQAIEEVRRILLIHSATP